MSINILRDKGTLIAEHATHIPFPIQYALVEDDKGFKILVYHERFNYLDNRRAVASDMPFAVWKPDTGLQSLAHNPYYMLYCAGMTKEMSEFCEAAYQAWLDGQEPKE